MVVKPYAVRIDRLLRSLPSLAPLSGPWWQSALVAAHVVQACDGDEFSEDIVCLDHATLMLQGSLRIRIRADDGRVFSLYRVHAGELCALSIACMRENRLLVSHIEAEGCVVALRLPREKLNALISHSPEFRELLMSSMTIGVQRLLDVIQETAFEHLDQRIQRRLREKYYDSDNHVLYLTHQELADELGTTRVVVSRLLKQLENQGQLKLARGSIMLLDAFPY